MQSYPPKYDLSYWEREVFFPNFDVIVVGSGIVGLTAAIHLKERSQNLNVAILERGILPAGASTRNAGFACFGSITELMDDLKHQSEAQVWALVEQRWKGLRKLLDHLGERNIQYQKQGGYELFLDGDEEEFQKATARIADFNHKLKEITGEADAFQVVDEKIPELGFEGVQHLIFNPLEGQLHTGKMMKALIHLAREKQIAIFNGMNVHDIEQDHQGILLKTHQGWNLKARKVIIATNGFTDKFFPDLAVEAVRNQVLITKPIENLRIKGCFHYDCGYYYFRDVGQRVLFGGGRNKALDEEKTNQFGTTSFIRAHLVDLLRKNFIPKNQFEVDSWWSGILGVGPKKMPIVQREGENMVVAARLGGMGVALGSLVGEEAASLLF